MPANYEQYKICFGIVVFGLIIIVVFSTIFSDSSNPEYVDDGFNNPIKILTYERSFNISQKGFNDFIKKNINNIAGLIGTIDFIKIKSESSYINTMYRNIENKTLKLIQDYKCAELLDRYLTINMDNNWIKTTKRLNRNINSSILDSKEPGRKELTTMVSFTGDEILKRIIFILEDLMYINKRKILKIVDLSEIERLTKHIYNNVSVKIKDLNFYNTLFTITDYLDITDNREDYQKLDTELYNSIQRDKSRTGTIADMNKHQDIIEANPIRRKKNKTDANISHILYTKGTFGNKAHKECVPYKYSGEYRYKDINALSFLPQTEDSSQEITNLADQYNAIDA